MRLSVENVLQAAAHAGDEPEANTPDAANLATAVNALVKRVQALRDYNTVAAARAA